MGLWVRKETGEKRPEYYVRWKIIQTEKITTLSLTGQKEVSPFFHLAVGKK
jgi:hypothetical protein